MLNERANRRRSGATWWFSRLVSSESVADRQNTTPHSAAEAGPTRTLGTSKSAGISHPTSDQP